MRKRAGIVCAVLSCALALQGMPAWAGSKHATHHGKTAAKASQGKAKSVHGRGNAKKVAYKAAERKSSRRAALAPVPARQKVRLAEQRARKAAAAKMTRVSALPSSLHEPSLYSSAVLVVNEQSGERIYEKNAQVVAPIASITKLMTAMVVLDMQLPLDELIAITDDDVDTLKNTRSRLAVGTTLTRGEMMHLALMASENRAAHALARTAAGGLAAFIERMNRTAQAHGMKDTRFADPTGLTSSNVSTANDLMRLVQAAHRYPEIHQYSTSETYSFVSNLNGRESVYNNTNPLVKSENWQIGVSKTGYISEAGKCLVMQATISDTPVVIVLLDSAGKLTRVGDANRIKRWLETNPGAKLRAG